MSCVDDVEEMTAFEMDSSRERQSIAYECDDAHACEATRTADAP